MWMDIYRVYFSFELKKKVFAIVEKHQVEKPDTFTEKLITQIIKNLQVKISNIHIRYEDDVSILIGETYFYISIYILYGLLTPALLWPAYWMPGSGGTQI